MAEWHEEIAGEDTEALEALQKFETPAELFKAHQELATKDWRSDIAGEDETLKSTLERFTSPADLGKSYLEAQTTIRSGKARQPLPENATEDDIKAYREANGIPLEPGGYLKNLPEGLAIGEDDKAIVEEFIGALHAKNVDPAVAHTAIEWYNGFAEKEQAALAELDAEQHRETEDLLRQEWQGDYRANINLIGAFLEKTFGGEVKDQLMNGRLGDGRAFMNDPEIVKGLAQAAREINPSWQLPPGPTGDPMQTLKTEKEAIEKVMSENRAAYNKDAKMQARYRELIQIELDHKASKERTAA